MKCTRVKLYRYIVTVLFENAVVLQSLHGFGAYLSETLNVQTQFRVRGQALTAQETWGISTRP